MYQSANSRNQLLFLLWINHSSRAILLRYTSFHSNKWSSHRYTRSYMPFRCISWHSFHYYKAILSDEGQINLKSEIFLTYVLGQTNVIYIILVVVCIVFVYTNAYILERPTDNSVFTWNHLSFNFFYLEREILTEILYVHWIRWHPPPNFFCFYLSIPYYLPGPVPLSHFSLDFQSFKLI